MDDPVPLWSPLWGWDHSFDDPGHFLLWLQDRGDVSNEDVYLRGVLARGEEGSQEVTTFFRRELRLAPTLVRWQQRTLQYLRNQCGHRFCKERAVCQTCQSDIAIDEESQEEESVSPACNVTKVMMLMLHHPISSELCHRLRLGGGGV